MAVGEPSLLHNHFQQFFYIYLRVVDGIRSMKQSVLYFKAASGQKRMQQLCGPKHLFLFFFSDNDPYSGRALR